VRPRPLRRPRPLPAPQVRRLLFVIAALVTLLFVQLGATFGLVFAVISVTKDSHVDGSGALVGRDGSYLGTAPVLLSIMSSDVPDAAFTDVRSLSVQLANGGGTAQLQVNGFVRLPVSALGSNTQALVNGPLMLLTPYGNMLLAGTTVTPLDSVLADMIHDATTVATSLSTASPSRRSLLASPLTGGTVTVGAISGTSSTTTSPRSPPPPSPSPPKPPRPPRPPPPPIQGIRDSGR
jgi:hypothetical protein